MVELLLQLFGLISGKFMQRSVGFPCELSVTISISSELFFAPSVPDVDCVLRYVYIIMVDVVL